MKVTLTVHGKELNGEEFVFYKPGSFLFGSSKHAQCRITGDPYVSRSHFYLSVDPSEVRLCDLQSVNGTEVDGVLYTGGKGEELDEGEEMNTFVKGERPPALEGVSLHDGSVIEAGYTKITVDIEKDAECKVCGGAIPYDEKDAAGSAEGFTCKDCPQRQVEHDMAHEKERLKQLIEEGNQLIVQRRRQQALDRFRAAAQIDRRSSQVKVGLERARRLRTRVNIAKEGRRDRGRGTPPGTGRPDDIEPTILQRLGMHKPEGPIPNIPGYGIVRLLDDGGMGAVFEARDLVTGRTVAIKVILPDRSLTREPKSRFRAETRLTRKLKHPNIVEYIAGGDTNGLLWQALEYVEDGLNVDKKMRMAGGHLPGSEALTYVVQSLEGLAYAHNQGIVHGDIRPSNILLAPGGSFVAKLADFGLVKSLEKAQLNGSIVTKPGLTMGSLPYMPPEQVIDVRSAKPPADVFSMGATLYHMLTGHSVRNFARQQNVMIRQVIQEEVIPIEKLDPAISGPLAKVINKSLNLDPGYRYADGAEFKAALQDTGQVRLVAKERKEKAEFDADDDTHYKPSHDARRTSAHVRHLPDQIELPRKEEASRTDDVRFSVTSPPKVSPGDCFVVDVWAHLHDQLAEVLHCARNALSGERIEAKTKGVFEVVQGAVLSVELAVKGLLVDEPRDFILWKGKIANATFLVTVPDGVVPGSKSGCASIYSGGLKIGKLDFVIRVGPVPSSAARLPTEEVWLKNAFASYASEDRDEVLARVHGMQKVAPQMSVFVDVLSLRSGEEWEEAIRTLIPKHDIFYLFWSAHARASRGVEKEWRCALETRGIDFIDPVPLVSPESVPPPSELASKHFNDWTLAFMRRP